MAVSIDLSGTENPEKAGEFERVLPGAAHLLVLEVKENGGKGGEHLVKYEVLMHSQPTEIGKTHTEYYPATAEMAWKILGFAYATGVTTREEMARQKAMGNNYPPLEILNAQGQQLFGTFKSSEKNGKHFINLQDLLSVADPKADRHPRNVGMLKSLPLAATTTAATQATQSVVGSAAALNPFAGLT